MWSCYCLLLTLLFFISCVTAKILLVLSNFPDGRLIKCTPSGKLMKSLDGGMQWTAISLFRDSFFTSVTSDRTGIYLIASSKNHGVFLSHDSGDNWDVINRLDASLEWIGVASDTIGENLAAIPARGGIYISHDHGRSWKEASSAPKTNKWSSIACDHTGQYLTAISENDGIYTSFDYGENWMKVNTPLDIIGWRDVAVDSSGQYLAAIAPPPHGIFHSTNYGLHWMPTSALNLTSYQWENIASDRTGQFLSAVTRDGKIFLSLDYGDNWFQSTTFPSNLECESVFFDRQGDSLLAVTKGNEYQPIYYSADRGNHWITNVMRLKAKNEEEEAKDATAKAFDGLFIGYKGFVPKQVRKEIAKTKAEEKRKAEEREYESESLSELQKVDERMVLNAEADPPVDMENFFNNEEPIFDQAFLSPTMEPTEAPSLQPSSTPSTFPSNKPSAEPASQPSTIPSVSPSAAPSMLPNSLSASSSFTIRNMNSFAAKDAGDTVWVWGGSQLLLNNSNHLIVPNVSSVVSTLNAYTFIFQNHDLYSWGAQTAIDGWQSYSAWAKIAQIFGTEHAFAGITTDGGVVAFGSVGHGGLIPIEYSSYLQDKVVGMVANAGAFCAWKEDGSLFCWGNPNTGGDISSLSNILLKDIKQVFATRTAFAGLTKKGVVFSWGDCLHGGCQSPLENINLIVTTPSVFIAITDTNELITWGNSQYGGNIPSTTKDLIGTIASRIYHNAGAIAVLLANGEVVAWGDANYGGDCSTVSSQLVDIVSIVNSDRAFAAIDKNGKVIVWGNEIFGGEIPDSLVHRLASGVVSVVSSKAAFAALTSTGAVITWGNSLFGGDSTSVISSLSSDVTEVEGNLGGFIAIQSSGNIIGWGNKAIFGNSEVLLDHVANLPVKFVS